MKKESIIKEAEILAKMCEDIIANNIEGDPTEDERALIIALASKLINK